MFGKQIEPGGENRPLVLDSLEHERKQRFIGLDWANQNRMDWSGVEGTRFQL